MYYLAVRRTAEEAAQTRTALLEAALFVFAERGLAAARLGDVAERAGVTRGAVYHHFADKEALFAAVVEHGWTTLTSPVWAVLDESGPPARRLDRFLRAWLHHLREDDRFRALLTVTVNGGVPLDESSGAAKAAGLREWHAQLAGLLAEAARDAHAAPGLDPAQAAKDLIAWMCGTALVAATDPELLPAAGPAGSAPILRGMLP